MITVSAQVPLMIDIISDVNSTNKYCGDCMFNTPGTCLLFKETLFLDQHTDKSLELICESCESTYNNIYK